MKKSQGVDFDTWYAELERLAEQDGTDLGEPDLWSDDYDNDMTPQEALDAIGEMETGVDG
jgi:hypothetical protein